MTRQPKIVPRSYFWGWKKTVCVGAGLGVVATAVALATSVDVLWVAIPVVVISALSRRLGDLHKKCSAGLSARSMFFLFDGAYVIGSLAVGLCINGPPQDLLLVSLLVASLSVLTIVAPSMLGSLIMHTLWPVRTERTACGACAYSLAGNVSGVCPECGEAVLDAEPS